MKYNGNTVSIVVTIPESEYYKKFKAISDYSVDGYECKVVRNAISKRKKQLSEQELKTVQQLKIIANDLRALEKNRETATVVIRTTLIYYLKKKYSGPLLARVFNCNDSNIVFCVRRYKELKHYPDYEQASNKIIQHLRRCSLADYFREMP